jgi:hypothetical protein
MKKLLYATFMLVFVSAFQNHSQAQEVQQASLSPTGILQVPVNSSPNDVFKFDISHLNLQSEQEMIQYFNEKCGNNHIFRPLVDENTAILYLQTKRQPTWTQSDWNAYLQNECVSKPIIQ